jgi:hypothetical protein
VRLDVLELLHELGHHRADALLAHRQRLPDAEDHLEPGGEGVGELGGEERGRLRGRRQAELAAPLRVAHQHPLDAHGRHLRKVRASTRMVDGGGSQGN